MDAELCVVVQIEPAAAHAGVHISEGHGGGRGRSRIQKELRVDGVAVVWQEAEKPLHYVEEGGRSISFGQFSSLVLKALRSRVLIFFKRRNMPTFYVRIKNYLLISFNEEFILSDKPPFFWQFVQITSAMSSFGILRFIN